tara:strand:- start:2061 stop:2171 length:111 start_codon:yes stop_codon:yes gene_type:complete
MRSEIKKGLVYTGPFRERLEYNTKKMKKIFEFYLLF